MFAGNIIDGIARQGRVRPALQTGNKRPLGNRVRSRIEHGFRETAFKLFDNPRGITKNVRADLEGRRTTVAAGEGNIVRLGQGGGNLDRAPGQTLETQDETDLFRIVREIVVMQNEFRGHWFPSLP